MADTNLTYYCDKKRHLVCLPYSIENLHKMAIELGIDKCWFEISKGKAHYDIPKQRISEVTSKCIVILPKEIVKIIKGERK